MFFSFLSHTTRLTFVLLSILFLMNNIQAATIYFVYDNSTSPSPDGTSWETAFPSIQSAIDEAVSNGASETTPVEIWVAEGTYTGSDENVVEMAEYVDLYGGFAGTETELDQRDWNQYTSTVDGENTRRGVLGADQATLDGFVITKGFHSNFGGGMKNDETTPTVSNCIFSYNIAESGSGGGMHNVSCSPMISNCTFSFNSSRGGGGIGNYEASPTISECTFKNNTTNLYDDGGGIANLYLSSPIITNCIFTENSATNGGGMKNYNSSPIISNCRFNNNHAVYNGGGIENYISRSSIINCTFTNNFSPGAGSGIYNWSNSWLTMKSCTLSQNYGHGIYNAGSILNVSNSILWGNGKEIEEGHESDCTVTFSCIEGGFEGEGNISSPPLFWNSPLDDYRLHKTSPCINSGTTNNAPSSDNRGIPRPYGDGIDMGAFEMNEVDSDNDNLYDPFEKEYSDTNPTLTDTNNNGQNDGNEWFIFQVWYVNKTKQSPTRNGKSWEMALSDIQSAVDEASIHGGGEVWVAQGIYTGENENVVILQNNVHLYGGFSGNEDELTQRNPRRHQSIIDGEEERRGAFGANNSTLDGFVITNGHSEHYSTGMLNNYFSPTIRNCWFVNNQRNGITNANSFPEITNCIFANNNDYGMLNFRSYPYSIPLSPSILNCTFTGNSLAGVSNSRNTPILTNCIFWDNETEIHDYSLSNPIVTYCCVQGGYTGEGNIDSNPLFIDSENEDFALRRGSPCIDTGTQVGAPNTDIIGISRPNENGVDIGAYESVFNPVIFSN